jgi:hypothetical protein
MKNEIKQYIAYGRGEDGSVIIPPFGQGSILQTAATT